MYLTWILVHSVVSQQKYTDILKWYRTYLFSNILERIKVLTWPSQWMRSLYLLWTATCSEQILTWIDVRVIGPELSRHGMPWVSEIRKRPNSVACDGLFELDQMTAVAVRVSQLPLVPNQTEQFAVPSLQSVDSSNGHFVQLHTIPCQRSRLVTRPCPSISNPTPCNKYGPHIQGW